MNLLSGATVSLDPKDIRVGTSFDQVLAQQIGAANRRAESGAGHRAERAAARRRPVDDLRVVHLVGLADQARHEGDLSGADLRPVGRRRQGPAARPQHSRRRARQKRTRSSPSSARATARSWTNTWSPSATSRSASTTPRRKSAWKAGGRRCNSRTCRARRTSFRRTCPAHMKLMLDLIVLAFQMDKTRIVT